MKSTGRKVVQWEGFNVQWWPSKCTDSLPSSFQSRTAKKEYFKHLLVARKRGKRCLQYEHADAEGLNGIKGWPDNTTPRLYSFQAYLYVEESNRLEGCRSFGLSPWFHPQVSGNRDWNHPSRHRSRGVRWPHSLRFHRVTRSNWVRYPAVTPIIRMASSHKWV